MVSQRVYIKRKPRYYIRMNIDGRWFFLWKIIYRQGRPIWWEEAQIGESKPYLYKTLVGARNSLDRYVSSQAVQSEVAIWKDHDGQLQTESA